MHHAILLSLLFLALVPTKATAAAPGERERAFLRGLELFDAAKSSKEYRDAAKEWESICQDGFQNGAVYYNIGNAYYRAGDYGKAILNYRKAKPFRPQDPYLTANLEQALAVAPGRLPGSPTPWWSHVLFWHDWISFPGKVRLAFACLALFAIAAAAAFATRQRRLIPILAGFLITGLALSIDVVLSHAQAADSRRAVITSETIARKGTGITYEPAFDQPLRDGAEFQILDQTSDWTFGHFDGIGDGWVRNEHVAQ